MLRVELIQKSIEINENYSVDLTGHYLGSSASINLFWKACVFNLSSLLIHILNTWMY